MRNTALPQDYTSGTCSETSVPQALMAIAAALLEVSKSIDRHLQYADEANGIAVMMKDAVNDLSGSVASIGDVESGLTEIWRVMDEKK